MQANKQKHLTLEERRVIETGITNGSTKVAIAQTLGKDKSTIGKEIKLHRQLVRKCRYPVKCRFYKNCKNRECLKRASQKCEKYEVITCSRRDRSPGACNGCPKKGICPYDIYCYNPGHANVEYRETLVNTRKGIDLTEEQLKHTAEVVGPLLRKGQSPYHIISSHPELGISERTLYNYIDKNLFRDYGILPIDLRRKVSRKPSKKKDDLTLKKRQDRKYLKGRLYKDFLSYMEFNPDAFIVEMDTVYNDITTGPFIQTFKFLKFGFLFAVFHTELSAAEMVRGVDLLETILGRELFCKYVEVLLTDRGSEFSSASLIEDESSDNSSLRTKVFYCDPMAANQKGSLENKHEELRYICPKGVDLYALGLVSQEKLNLVLSHVNSHQLESLNKKTSLEVLEFFAPDLFEKFTEFGILKIEKDKVVLKPYLLK